MSEFMSGFERIPTGDVDEPGQSVCGVHWRDRVPAKAYRLLRPTPTGQQGMCLYASTRRGPYHYLCDGCAAEAARWFDVREVG